MDSTLVEPLSVDGNADSRAAAAAPEGGSEGDERSQEGGRGGLEGAVSDGDGRTRSAFQKCRSRVERNLHVLNPLVTSVSRLGQQLLAGVEIIDFDSPR